MREMSCYSIPSFIEYFTKCINFNIEKNYIEFLIVPACTISDVLFKSQLVIINKTAISAITHNYYSNHFH